MTKYNKYWADEFYRVLFVDRGASILFFYVRKADTKKRKKRGGERGVGVATGGADAESFLWGT